MGRFSARRTAQRRPVTSLGDVNATDALEIPLAINLVAVFVGALGGTLRAGEDEKTDLVGVFTLAAAMGFGGGVVRDVLLGNLPPAAFRDAKYLIAAGAATGIGALFLYYLRKLEHVLWGLDALSVGLFACTGTNAAQLAGLGYLPSIIIGTLSSIGGLLLTDMLQGRPSSILYVGPPNAMAGLAGAAMFAAVPDGTSAVGATILAVAATVLVRASGKYFHVTVPQPRLRAYETAKARRTRAKSAHPAMTKRAARQVGRKRPES